MVGKGWETRWDDTINYLNRNFPADRLGDHINGIVPQGMRKAISAELSIGRRTDGEDDEGYAASTSQRHALRGLFMCQRVYYSSLWAKKTWSLTDYRSDTMALAANWKIDSMGFWGGRSEPEILSGIGMFTPIATATLQDLVDVAKEGPPNGAKRDFLPGNLFLSRGDTENKGAAETCYNGVVAWLVRSGLVSMRWLMLDSAPNGKSACDRLFGTGEIIWDTSAPFKATSVLPHVEAGYIVHMWLEDGGPGVWNGHWVISNGDGTICGVHNGEVNKEDEQVLTSYTNNGKLRSQFEAYGGLLMKQIPNTRGFLDLVPIEPQRYGRACMVKFNPLELPNRI